VAVNSIYASIIPSYKYNLVLKSFSYGTQVMGHPVQGLQPNLKPIQTWREVLSKRVPILGEGIACNQDPDSLHCKALKRTKSLDELKIKSWSIIRLILIFTFLVFMFKKKISVSSK
jgi:hypothetical protein